MAVNITEGGSAVTYKNQQRSDKSAQEGLMGEDGEYEVLLPRFIYSKLGNLTDNKVITDEDVVDEKNEYYFFMSEMNKLQEAYLSGTIPADLANIEKIDNYLGMLGAELEYPFDDDGQSIPLWLNAPGKIGNRNVIDNSFDTIYNVIDSYTGDNVIHQPKE